MFGSYEFNGLDKHMKLMYRDKVIFDSENYMTVQDCLDYLAKQNLKPMLSCPNCGAPITGSKCEYCRTDFEKSKLWGNVR